MPYTLEKIEQFFEVYHIHPQLVHSLELIYKSEYESAVREATVVVETFLRHESGLNTHGVDLVNKALGFKRKGETIINPPLIQINELKSESDWNEQDGIRNMCVGFFQGPRNLYQHNGIGSGVSNSLSIVIEASFLLTCIDGGSILRNGKWIPTRINYREIYKKMPKTIDRLRLLRDRLNHG